MFTSLKLLADVVSTGMPGVSYAPVNVGFTIPPFDAVLTFVIRFFFIVAGIMAILYLLLGAFAWITSGGNKESVDKARDKILNAVIGIILIFVVLALVAVIEQVFFPAGSGLGITKPILFPKLVNQ